MEYKKFSSELYKQNDNIAKNASLEFLLSRGKFKINTPLNEQKEAYKEYDFIINKISDGSDIKIEVERKLVWKKSGQWEGYNTIDVPYRKNESKSHYFIMINYHMNTLAITETSNILNAPTSKKKTIYTGDELFFNVSLDVFAFYTNLSGKWKRIK